MLSAKDILGELVERAPYGQNTHGDTDKLSAIQTDKTGEGDSPAAPDINTNSTTFNRGGAEQQINETTSSPMPESKTPYAGDVVDLSGPLKDDYETLDFPNPAVMLAFYNDDIREGTISLHKWQAEDLEMLGAARPTAQKPFKYCLRACNGSGKDSFMVASFAAFVCLAYKRFRVIITSSSGVQLTAQTESPLVDFCQRVNKKHGCEIFKIRQRFIRCNLSGSEIRLFATDEKGRAEGYHPIVPNAGMAIIVSEGKTVTDEIHNALRRCTGYNFWVEVSTPGEPKGFFFKAATTWKHTRQVTTYDCSHLSLEELEEDKLEWGETSALFRSKHLAEFTTVGNETIVPVELVDYCFKNPPEYEFIEWEPRIGIDLAAGAAENAVCITKGNAIFKELAFREVDTTITAERINTFLLDNKISKENDNIYADDGGVGHSIIDMLVRMGWKIKRVLNQWAAIIKRSFGNRGAENWFRIKRILEEHLFDITGLSELTRKQLSDRKTRPQTLGGRISLEPKREAIAAGRLSPDRADAFVLSLSGLTIDDFFKASRQNKPEKKPTVKLPTQEAVYEHYEHNITFKHFDREQKHSSGRIYNSLRRAMNN